MELIIVVIIIGILAAVALPRYTGSIEQRRGEACASNMRVVLSAWRIYNMNHTPQYTPTSWEFHNISWINNKFGTTITEKYFGKNSGNTPGFYFRSDTTNPNPNARYLRLRIYRIGQNSNNRLVCSYYYQRTKNIWRWWGTWPWLPENE